MGIDCGFDMFPRLDAGNASDRQAYREFLDEIVETYGDAYEEKGSDVIKVLRLPARDSGAEFPTNTYIYFRVGEGPKMPASPKRCNYFLRFSSKISGRQGHAEPYIDGVYLIAQKHFGARVKWWHELNDSGEDSRKWRGYYNWRRTTSGQGLFQGLSAGRA
ncbi:hypothetical protein F5144DRAFT_391346 [Chaetomium tenue]|uniref:Uncharacterized protein n=1 Tax=Chaetomium tenue TaxID=1854479 RepID=A0ACB7NX52_9PEZI|nr:hypothetical protein F5144DRAFT_391346 [Chaetomium globosum]